MKKSILLIAFAMAFARLAWGKSVPQSTTITTTTTDPTNTNQTVQWLSAPDGKLHQLHANNAGDLFTAPGPQGAYSGVTVAGYSGAAMVLTATPSAMYSFQLMASSSTTGVLNTSMYGITISAKSYLCIQNPNTAGNLRFILSNSTTPPTNSNSVYQVVQPGQVYCKSTTNNSLVPGYSILHTYWENNAAMTLTPTGDGGY